MGHFEPMSQFGTHLIVDWVLGVYEPVLIVRITRMIAQVAALQPDGHLDKFLRAMARVVTVIESESG